jgi:transposase
MSRTLKPYPPEFREQILELVRAGRTPNELAEELEPSGETIRNWIKQAEVDRGNRQPKGLNRDEKQELNRLRRENKQLRIKREILAKAAAGSLGRPARFPTSLRVREGTPAAVSGYHDVFVSGSRGGRLEPDGGGLGP